MPSIRRFLEMIRFSHTLFALPFALLSSVLAWYVKGFSWLELGGILLGMVFARSAAMAFNRLADRYLDAGNPAHGSKASARGAADGGRRLGFHPRVRPGLRGVHGHLFPG